MYKICIFDLIFVCYDTFLAMSFSMDCKAVGDLANKIWSSAYSIRNNSSSSIENKPSMSVLTLVTISLQHHEK